MEAPSPSELLRYPAVGGLCVIALGLYAAVPPDAIEPLQLDLRALSLPPFGPEPWRLLTAALLHAGQLQGPDMIAGLIHAGFNCYWLWTLGTAIEQRLGHLATLAMLVLFAVGGSLLEYAFNGAAVGLSGVVYGVAALLTVLARRSPRWRGTIDERTSKFFAVWFLICVAATAAEIMNIANFAHAGGAILGALLGWAMIERGPRRALAGTALAICLGLFFAG
ncbi:MAG: rhomboid family intramembrane serine protease, partial [Myxococcales bacterium]|nr:rhomboid family intramembrane serine protease [Myxococcales bacterium]